MKKPVLFLFSSTFNEYQLKKCQFDALQHVRNVPTARVKVMDNLPRFANSDLAIVTPLEIYAFNQGKWPPVRYYEHYMQSAWYVLEFLSDGKVPEQVKQNLALLH